MRKASRSLSAARLLLENGFTDEAASRAYYAMFDAARAALIAANAPAEAESARTHSGLIAAFARFIIAPGLLEREIGRTLGQAQYVRLIADYQGDPIGAAEASRAVEWAETFIKAVAERFQLNIPQSTRR
ncbi:MAG TPA: HEPN domain-containing protein [Roseiarcus sp.]|nr:HEPN domain-containing protein [Roseiarcus sp.]